jgi:hypothetical protein
MLGLRAQKPLDARDEIEAVLRNRKAVAIELQWAGAIHFRRRTAPRFPLRALVDPGTRRFTSRR